MTINTQTDRQALFQERKKKFDEQRLAYKEKFNLFSTFRILFFIAGLILLVYFANKGELNFFLLLVFLLPILFGFIIQHHNKLKYGLNQSSFLASINEREVLRLNLELNSFDPGNDFIDPSHPYSSDLNIFGKHSLFQLLNRTVTSNGRILLAQALKYPLNLANGVKERQMAVKELSEKLEFVQEFQARGMHEEHKKTSQEFLLEWVNEPLGLKNLVLLKILSFVFPIALLIALVGFFSFGISGYFVVAAAIANGIILSQTNKIIAPIAQKIDQAANILRTYSTLLNAVESENFSSPYLKELQRKIATSGIPASEEIKRLSVIVRNLEYRNNPYFFMTINLLTLWDLQWVIRLDKWKKEVSADIRNWLEAVNEFEVLISFGGFAFSFPQTIYPEISSTDFIIEGKDINHPLIPAAKRVGNPISLMGVGKTHVITGSNMSGKSTYMRTIGINSVMALIGLPISASSFVISPVKVFTCMHIHDSLEEATSSFYAELKRIKQLLMELNGDSKFFYLLDELLKGTNSVDRNLGAQAIIRQLHRKQASGLISTHDLDLGKMEHELPRDVKNFSFNSEIINNEIVFDYHLKEGVCHSFNASKLMEKMGIEINDQITADHSG